MKRDSRFLAATVVVAWLASPFAPVWLAAAAPPSGVLEPVPSNVVMRSLTPAAQELVQRGYLPRDAAAYARGKAVLDSLPAASSSLSLPTQALASSTTRSWQGINDTTVTPSDSTGAIGPGRYVELVNLKFAIYNRTSNTPLATGSLASLTGDTSGHLSDPQILWDPATNRFYYVVLDFASDIFAVGFSTSASPNTASDWCKYVANFGYGTNLPDFPKLGDTQDFWMIGVNVFNSRGLFVRTDVNWITKPGAGTTCPAASSFLAGQKAHLLNADGTQAFTPVPANQTDPSHQGWIVASKDTTVGSASVLSIFSVTKNANGTASIAGTASSVSVSSYSLPPSAPQAGTSHRLDTLDGRLTQAVSAVDPASGVVEVWTQHTVAGGAGSEVRWYEVNPAAPTIFQSGKATSSALFAFNGAVAPDRHVNGTAMAFGHDVVLGFDTSSLTTDVAIQMVSKVGANPQSSFVLIQQSPGPNIDFSCSSLCRWGDYSGATPDPASATTNSTGQVWLTNMWNVRSATSSDVDWRTWNWAVTP